MFRFEANEAVIIEQQKALEAALSSNPKTQKVLQKLIRKFILQARAEVAQSIKFKGGDPRHAAQAVRTMVYRKVLGGNINIYSSKKAHASNSYEPPRKLREGQRGGNRRKRSARTQRMMNYAPLDRGMILRWQNDGTSVRSVEFSTNPHRKVDKWNKHPNTGNRKSLTAQHFFRSLGDRALGRMRDTITTAIEQELSQMINDKK